MWVRANDDKQTPLSYCCVCQQEFWYFGVANVVRSFFTDPAWAEERRKPKDESPGSLYGGKMCQDINSACNGLLMHEDSSGYGIGFDFTQIYNFKTHSSGAMFLRSRIFAAYVTDLF